MEPADIEFIGQFEMLCELNIAVVVLEQEQHAGCITDDQPIFIFYIRFFELQS